MSFTIYRRQDNGKLAYNIYIKFKAGQKRRLRMVCRAQSGCCCDRCRECKRAWELAREEAAAEETKLIREALHGKPDPVVDPYFADAAKEYLKAKKRSKPEQDRLTRVVLALGDGKRCSDIKQRTLNDLVETMFMRALPDGSAVHREPAGSTVLRAVITPIRCVLHYARDHMDYEKAIPKFVVPEQPEGRTKFLFPGEAVRLLAASAPHSADQFLFRLGCGGRVSESLYIEWSDIDLVGAQATFWPLRKDENGNKVRNTKSGRRRVAELPPILVARLKEMAEQCPTKIDGRPVGRVFQYRTVEPRRLKRRLAESEARLHRARERLVGARPGRDRRLAEDRVRELEAETRRRAEAVNRSSQPSDYVDRVGEYGGQTKTAWRGALRRAGLNPELTPHDLRHTWATWHYALHKDLLKLKHDGGWAGVRQVERYAHVMPAGYENEIRAFLDGRPLLATQSDAGHDVCHGTV